MKVWDIVDAYLMRDDHLKAERLPTFYPSACGCVDEQDKTKMIGTCLRANYYRCAKYDVSDPNTVWTQYVFGGKIKTAPLISNY